MKSFRGHNFLRVFLAGGLGLTACSGAPPSTVGEFAPCPESPNCVSTRGTDEAPGMEPLRYETSTSQARDRLLRILQAMPRTRIVQKKENFIHAECTSRIFRFVDDVEFYLDPQAKKIDFRSASRVGYSDLGVNRKRMEWIQKKFNEKP